MNAIDRLRIRSAVLDYDFWLDLEGVPAAERRERRRELHANLTEASADLGYREARARIGSLRALAAAGHEDRHRPRWLVGTWWALAAFVLAAWSTLLLSTAWLDGATAAGVEGRAVHGSPALAPWIHASVDATGGAHTLSFSVNPLVAIVPMVLAFLLGARAWRLVTSRGSHSA